MMTVMALVAVHTNTHRNHHVYQCEFANASFMWSNAEKLPGQTPVGNFCTFSASEMLVSLCIESVLMLY